jgi:hypothetical protein
MGEYAYHHPMNMRAAWRRLWQEIPSTLPERQDIRLQGFKEVIEQALILMVPCSCFPSFPMVTASS